MRSEEVELSVQEHRRFEVQRGNSWGLRRWALGAGVISLTAAGLVAGCSSTFDSCSDTGTCPVPVGGSGGQQSSGAGGDAGEGTSQGGAPNIGGAHGGEKAAGDAAVLDSDLPGVHEP